MNIEGTNICADKFTAPHVTGECAYFLSHLHSDHMSGLSHSWKRGKIFCTSITRKLLIRKYSELEPLIFAMDYNVEYYIPNINGGFKVSAFDANHIMGSCMFIFEGKFGRILYTGDFRFTQEMLLNECLYPSSLRKDKNIGISKHIDLLILDNTFCDPMYNFPTQSEAFIQIVKIIQDHPLHKVIMFLYNVGKEELLIKLAHVFSTTVIL